MQRFLFMLFGAVLLCASHATPASALTRTFVNCPDGVPCEAHLEAHIDAVGPAHLPWVISVAAPAHVCFAVEVLASDAPVAITIVGPNGDVYRRKGKAAVDDTVGGWQTVQLDSVPPAAEQIVGDLKLSFPGACD